MRSRRKVAFQMKSSGAGVAFIHAAYGFGTIDDEVPEIEDLSQLPEVVEKVFAGK